MTAEQILNLFPHKQGIYRLVRRSRLYRAIKLGWRPVSANEDGRVIMWTRKGRLAR